MRLFLLLLRLSLLLFAVDLCCGLMLLCLVLGMFQVLLTLSILLVLPVPLQRFAAVMVVLLRVVGRYPERF